MTFLQPFILWGLPLLLVPVVIHLINRLRHRPQPWGAMRFLIAATRSSVSHARLRQFLILALRMLAVLMLVLFLARPLAGGWLGWALRPAPDVILLLVDRSASMESMVSSGISKRQEALRLLVEAARPFAESSHLVVLDSATRQAQEIASLKSLPSLSTVQPTDTAADMPGLFRAALRWLVDNKAGSAEIWLATDLQKSNWRPDDATWKDLIAQFQSLPQRVQIRLLPMTGGDASNSSLRLAEFFPPSLRQKPQLRLTLLLQRAFDTVRQVALGLSLNGAISQSELRAEGSTLRFRRTLDISSSTNGGWGRLSLPADQNPGDNSVYFAYGPPVFPRATIVAADASLARLFRLAAGGKESRVIDPAAAATEDLSKTSLLLWQGPFPTGAAADKVLQFAQSGGAVLFWPDASTNASAASAPFLKYAWGEVAAAPSTVGFPVQKWIEEEGPLARSEEGLSLPLRDTRLLRRRTLIGSSAVLAAYQDGVPFLARENVGRGQVFFCTSLPLADWSELGDGPVLVPMIRRLLDLGARRLQSARLLECGDLLPAPGAEPWVSLDDRGRDPRWHAGVYRSGEALLAVNRPAIEDEPESLPLAAAQRLFETLPLHLLNEPERESSPLQGEVWRLFLSGMLAFLFAEGWLMLPRRAAPPTSAAQAA